VPQRLRAETADLHVIFQHGEWLADLVRVRFEELALEVVARAPGQIAADVKGLPLDMEKHVLRENAFGRVGIMSAACGVDMMISAVEAVVLRFDPALQLDADHRLPFVGNLDPLFDHAILRTATVGHRQFARRQQHNAAAMAIDLVLEEKIGSETFCLRGINSAEFVLES